MTTQHPSALTMLLSRHTKRREFILALGGTAALPLAARAAGGNAGAAGPRLTALGRVSARLKRDWLRRGPNLLPAPSCAVLRPTIALLTSWTCRSQAGVWKTTVSSRGRRWRTGDESRSVASRWDAAPDEDTI